MGTAWVPPAGSLYGPPGGSWKTALLLAALRRAVQWHLYCWTLTCIVTFSAARSARRRAAPWRIGRRQGAACPPGSGSSRCLRVMCLRCRQAMGVRRSRSRGAIADGVSEVAGQARPDPGPHPVHGLLAPVWPTGKWTQALVHGRGRSKGAGGLPTTYQTLRTGVCITKPAQAAERSAPVWPVKTSRRSRCPWYLRDSREALPSACSFGGITGHGHVRVIRSPVSADCESSTGPERVWEIAPSASREAFGQHGHSPGFAERYCQLHAIVTTELSRR